MKLEVITLPFSADAGGFETDVLQAKLGDKEVVSYSEHFFTHDAAPWLCLVIAYQESRPGRRRAERSKGRDWGSELDGRGRLAFEALRAWRKERAAVDGVPVYLIATNRHLALLATRMPSTRSELGEIHGIGKGKLDAFAEDILRVLGAVPPAEAGEPPLEKPTSEDRPDE